MSAPSNRTTSSALLQALAPEQVLRLNHLAGQWHVRRQQADWSDADEQALQSWLAQDPAHRAALDGVQRTWQDAQQLKAMFAASYGHQPAAATATSTAADVDATPSSLPTASRSATRQSRSATSWWRRPSFSAVLASCFVALVLAGYGWHRWDNTASYTLEIATAPGELRTIDLPDGSRVALNANSHLQVGFYPRRRATVLDQGEAFFEVAADQSKPFTVDSGSSQVRVVGTAFNVRAAPPELLVQVQEGRVEVRSTSNAQAPVLVLGPGTGVAIDPASGQRRTLPVVPEAIAQWRTGQIYFKRAPLQLVADELSRYLGQPVEVDGAGIQALPISGLLALQEPERFLLALPSVAKVHVQQRAQGGWLISPR